MLARGLAATALLAVPVGVAAAIGFGTSVAGLTEGLGSLASGPEGSQAAPATTGSDTINSAIAALATPAPAPEGGNRGADRVGESPGVTSPGDDSSPGTSPTTGGGGGGPGSVVDPPEVNVPAAGNPVGDLVDGLNNTLNGLLGGQ